MLGGQFMFVVWCSGMASLETTNEGLFSFHI